ncbi:hypothetical protein SLE2022_345130 [Rubroshorea leprosula]
MPRVLLFLIFSFFPILLPREAPLKPPTLPLENPIFGSALLCSVLPRVALTGGVLPGFLVCREFLHFSPRRLPSQPDPVLLAGVSWY